MSWDFVDDAVEVLNQSDMSFMLIAMRPGSSTVCRAHSVRNCEELELFKKAFDKAHSTAEEQVKST